jgi:hypothetical protein
MRAIVLTGLRNEVDMETGQPTCFELVFNKGALHIPVSQETMKQVVGYAFEADGEQPVVPSPTEAPEPAAHGTSDEVQDVPAEDDGVEQF